MTVPRNYDDRLLLKKYLHWIPVPDLVILGDSRIMNQDGTVYDPAVYPHFLNASVTAANIRDFIGIWQTLKSYNKIPRHVILSVVPQSLYSNLEEGEGWYTLAAPFLQFRAPRVTSFKKRFKLVRRTVKRVIRFHWNFLTSAAALNSSLRSLREEPFRARLLRLPLAPSDDPARTHTFALLRREENAARAEIDRWGSENGQGEAWKLAHGEVFKEETFNELEDLVADMTALGVKVRMIVLPAHPSSRARVAADSQAEDALERLSARLEKLCADHGALYVDALLSPPENLGSENFFDGVHMKKEALDSFLCGAAAPLELAASGACSTL